MRTRAAPSGARGPEVGGCGVGASGARPAVLPCPAVSPRARAERAPLRGSEVAGRRGGPARRRAGAGAGQGRSRPPRLPADRGAAGGLEDYERFSAGALRPESARRPEFSVGVLGTSCTARRPGRGHPHVDIQGSSSRSRSCGRRRQAQ